MFRRTGAPQRTLPSRAVATSACTGMTHTYALHSSLVNRLGSQMGHVLAAALICCTADDLLTVCTMQVPERKRAVPGASCLSPLRFCCSGGVLSHRSKSRKGQWRTTHGAERQERVLVPRSELCPASRASAPFASAAAAVCGATAAKAGRGKATARVGQSAVNCSSVEATAETQATETR
jgi:hypothetical protein